MSARDEKLEAIRREIDDLDDELVSLINRRARLAQKIAQVKDGEGAQHYYRPDREAKVLRALVEKNDGPLPGENVSRIFQEIMSACRALQRPLTVALPGPQGTFTEAAAFKHFGHAIESLPLDSIEAVFRAVEAGDSAYGVVPVEESSEGVVHHTLDMFIDSSLSICGEVELGVRGNTTRFLVIGDQLVGPTGADKTSVLVTVKDRPGALYDLLSSFKRRNINVTRIESRPSRSRRWKDVFYVDLEGHAEEPDVSKSIEDIKAYAALVKILGSYPQTVSRTSE